MSYSMIEMDVIRWGEDRHIVQNSNPRAQAIKTLEEVGELMQAITDNDRDEIADAIGDVMVTLVNVGVLCDLDLRQCFYNAYKVIEPRKGYMNKAGQFVKES
jgi:NTP pyrophosphatase (non-canonical NTP hydrolase)